MLRGTSCFMSVPKGSWERGRKITAPFSFYLGIYFLLIADSVFSPPLLAVAFAPSDLPFLSSGLMSQCGTKAEVLYV